MIRQLDRHIEDYALKKVSRVHSWDKYPAYSNELLEGLGDVALCVVHESSDYGPYLEDFALRDSNREAWTGFLDKIGASWTIMYGPHDTQVFFVAMTDENDDWLSYAEKVIYKLKEFDDYPVMDEDRYGTLQWEYTYHFLESVFHTFPGIYPHIADSAMFATQTFDATRTCDNSSLVNRFHDQMNSCQYIDDETITELLQDSGYFVPRDGDTQEIDYNHHHKPKEIHAQECKGVWLSTVKTTRGIRFLRHEKGSPIKMVKYFPEYTGLTACHEFTDFYLFGLPYQNGY